MCQKWINGTKPKEQDEMNKTNDYGDLEVSGKRKQIESPPNKLPAKNLREGDSGRVEKSEVGGTDIL